MSTQLDPDLRFDNGPFQEQLPHHYRAILSDFRKMSRSFALFNGAFLALGLLEIGLFFFLLPNRTESSLFTVLVSAFFLSLFSYLVLLFYYQAKKPEQRKEWIQTFITSCHSSLQLFPQLTHHLSIADALVKLSQYLTGYEAEVLQISDRWGPLTRFISRCSTKFYWQDVFQFKRALLRAAVVEHFTQLSLTPTDLELHASLASTYIALSGLYKTPPSPHLNFHKKHVALFQEKFQAYGKLAIEEFQILNQYASNDPWIHEQLAAGYRSLSMPLEEIREVEWILKLRPTDREVSFRLGLLYFEQGFNAKGLQIYEELKQAGFKKASQLIAAYAQEREKWGSPDLDKF